MSKRLFIIADDLTGAMDSSGYLASHASITVALDPEFETTSDIMVFTTNSRHDSPLLASQKVKNITIPLKGDFLFKKIDSTLRGNIGPELEAMAEVLCCEKILVAPAFPASGRNVKDGILLVNGVPLARTELWQDFIILLKDSFIPSLFGLNSSFRTGIIELDIIEKGPDYLLREINKRTENVLVFDTLEQRHLQTIAKTGKTAGGRFLLCGSGGLAREMHIMVANPTPKAKPAVGDSSGRPVVLVVGSRHPVSAGQLLKVEDQSSIKLLHLETGELRHKDGKSSEISRLVNDANYYMKKGVSVAVTSTFSSFSSGMETEINATLADITHEIMNNNNPGGLFLSGGDTALAICEKIRASAIDVYGEVEPGIPAGNIIGWQNGLRVVTKAGAFGSENAIINSLRYLKGNAFLTCRNH